MLKNMTNSQIGLRTKTNLAAYDTYNKSENFVYLLLKFILWGKKRNFYVQFKKYYVKFMA